MLVILIVIGVIVYFVVTSGEDEGTDETPSPEEETTSLWQDRPGGSVFLAGDAAGGVPPRVLLSSA